MRNYYISELAINDLNSIWLYTFNKWSKEQADRYYRLIIDEIEFISKNQGIGKIFKSYRYSPIKSHLIYYREIKDGKIEIVRILHQRMEIKQHL